MQEGKTQQQGSDGLRVSAYLRTYATHALKEAVYETI